LSSEFVEQCCWHDVISLSPGLRFAADGDQSATLCCTFLAIPDNFGRFRISQIVGFACRILPTAVRVSTFHDGWPSRSVISLPKAF
jgi:hypothetical protein